MLAGQRAAVLVEDPHDGSVLAMVSMPSYDPNPFVKGISYQDYGKLLHDKNLPLINRVTQGLYPPASTVKPYMAMSALLSGIITPQTTFFGAPTWTLPGTQRHYRDWKKPDTVCWMSLKRLRNLRILFLSSRLYDGY